MYWTIYKDRIYSFSNKKDVIRWATKKLGNSFIDDQKILAARVLRIELWGKQ